MFRKVVIIILFGTAIFSSRSLLAQDLRDSLQPGKAWEIGNSDDSVAGYRNRMLVYGHSEFQGNLVLASSYLQDNLYSRPGDRPDSASMSEDVRRISLAYAQNGYPHAIVFISRLKVVHDSLIRVFTVKEGARITIGRLEFAGHRITKERILRKLTGIEVPWVFDSRVMERAVHHLEKSGLFSFVGQPYLSRTAGGEEGYQTLVFTLKEKTYNSVYGALGYNQDQGRADRWLAGAINLSLLNIAGTYRKCNILWERPRKDKSRLEIGFYEPWVLGYPVSGELRLGHIIEDSSYVQSRADVVFTFNFGDRIAAGFGIGLERVVPGTSQSVPGSIKYRSLWRLSWDGRDGGQGRMPWASLNLDYGRKRYYQNQSQYTVAKLAGDLEQLFRSGALVHPYFGSHGRMVISNESPVPRPEQYALGGAGSLRGYFEDQFRADQVAWGNFELRLTTGERISFYPFYDIGYYWDGGRGRRGIKHGFGLGFKLWSRLGRVEFDYGLGQGDGPWDGKVHLLLGSEF